MPDVTVGGLRFHYVDAPVAPRRPAIVFFHGAGANHTVWLAQMKALRDQAWVVIPDLPGHGKSDAIPGITIAEYAAAVIPFLEDLTARLGDGALSGSGAKPEQDRSAVPNEVAAGIAGPSGGSQPVSLSDQVRSSDRVEDAHSNHPSLLRAAAGGLYLAGHSMGGAIAMTIALERPDLVAGIVLVGSGAKLAVSPRILEGLQTSPRETQALLARWSFTPSADPALILRSMRDLAGTSIERTLADFHACNTFDLRSEIPRITAPTLIVSGTEDKMTPPAYAEWLARTLPHARVRLVQGAGHAIMVETPEAVSGPIAEFLRETAAHDRPQAG